MKRAHFISILTMAIMAVLTTACSMQQDEATTIAGTWKCDMNISSTFKGQEYEVLFSDVTFNYCPNSPTSGEGYWVDYYADGPMGKEYVANHINWSVDGCRLYIEFLEEGVALTLRNYMLGDNTLEGAIRCGNENIGVSFKSIGKRTESDYAWEYASDDNPLSEAQRAFIANPPIRHINGSSTPITRSI